MKKTKEKRKVGLGGEGSSEWGSEVRDKNRKKEKKKTISGFLFMRFSSLFLFDPSSLSLLHMNVGGVIQRVH